MVSGPEVGLPSITLEIRVDVGVVITLRVYLGHILCLVRLLAHTDSAVDNVDFIFCTAKIDAGFILWTLKTLLSN